MKYKILLAAFSFTFLFNATAQKTTGTAYAITSEKQGQFVWTEVKLIDLNTGAVVQSIFENSKASYNVFDVRTGKQVRIKDDKGMITDNSKLPFSSFSAACAYDKKHNRLYYTPMFINQLRYIDMDAKTPKIYYFEGENLSTATDLNNDANHITRMVIAADGNGYALNNDATHLIRFTTGRKPTITDLGGLIDDPQNGKVSIHNKCSSWGGDLIADAYGDLYLISAFHSIFKIDINNKMATYLGGIEGLPSKFTTNGAVIDNEGSLIVSSANSVEGYYKVDMKSLKAVKIDTKQNVFNTSDLANGNFAFQKEVDQQTATRLISRSIVHNENIGVYPNPVNEGVFRVSFENKEAGRYNIQLVDLLGRVLTQKQITVTGEGQVAEFELSGQISKGMYLVKVLNAGKKTVYADKIIVE